MSELPVGHSFVTPGGILAALFGFLIGGVSMAFNPFFALSVIAVALSLVALRRAAMVENIVVQGMLRIFAVIGILGAAGGVVAILFPGLGVRS
jgi:hypothetical protein